MIHRTHEDTPITWISSQKTTDEVAGILRSSVIIGKVIFIVQNALVGDFGVIGGKGRLPNEGVETDGADRPDIDLKGWGMAGGTASLGLDGLGGHKGGRSTASLGDGGASPVGLGSLKLPGKAKTGELELHILVEQECCRVDIAMDDVAFVVQILEGTDQLLQVVLGLGFRQTTRLPTVQHVLDRLVVAKLEDEVGARIIGEGMRAADDVLVDESAMDADFFLGLHNSNYSKFNRERMVMIKWCGHYE